MDTKIRFVTAALFFIALIAAATVYYTIKSNSREISPAQNAVTNTAQYSDWVIFQENGLYGIKNSDEEIIVEAKWDYLYSLDDGDYIVGESKHGVMSYGAIDEKGSIAIPVVYSRINVLNSEILSAKTFDDKFAVYNTELELFSSQEFIDIVQNSDGTYNFTAKNLSFTTSIVSGDILIEKIALNCNIDTTSKYIDIIPQTALTYSDALEYINIANESANYIEAIFYGDSEYKYPYEFLDDSILLGENSTANKTFYSLENIVPEIIRSDDGIHYNSLISFAYDVPVADENNAEEFINNRYAVDANLSFKKGFDGEFELISCTFSNS